MLPFVSDGEIYVYMCLRVSKKSWKDTEDRQNGGHLRRESKAGNWEVAHEELRETYGSLAFMASWFMNHVDLFKTLNLIKGSKEKVKFPGCRGNGEAGKEARRTEDCFGEQPPGRSKGRRETPCTPCPGAENA